LGLFLLIRAVFRGSLADSDGGHVVDSGGGAA